MFFQHANSSGRAEHDADFVLLDQAPPNATVRTDWEAFIKNGGHAANERTVNDVAVADHPTNVTGAEKCLAGFALENIWNAAGQCHRVATGVALHPFGLACCS